MRGPLKQPPQSTLFWALAIAIPIATVVSTQLWLRSAYSGHVFNLQGFLGQYDFGIFRYRLLGRDAMLFIYRHLLRFFHDRPFDVPYDPNATLLFYASYVLLNASCFSLSNFLLLLLLADRNRRLGDVNLATYFYLTLMQALAMAVVSPYDQLAYLFLLMGFFSMAVSRGWVAYLVLAFAAIAGALTRETQFLVTPALFSVALFAAPGRSKRFWTAGFCNLVLFSLVYCALRVFIPGPIAVTGEWTYGGKWAIESACVLAMLLFVGTSLALRIHADIRPTIALLLFSTPYILTVLTTGTLRELRLLVPVLLAQTFVYLSLAKINPAQRPINTQGDRPGIDRLDTEAVDAGGD